MSLVLSFPVGVVVGAVAAVVSKVVYSFVAKQIASVKKDVPAVAAKVEADVAKKV